MKKKNFNVIITLLFILILTTQIIIIYLSYQTYKKISENQTQYQVQNLGENTDFEYDADTLEDIDKLKEQGKPIIIMLGADYCPTCNNYKPYVKEMYEKYKDEVTIKFVDTKKHTDIREVYNIELVPSTLIFEANGEAYRPSENIFVDEQKKEVEERKHISTNFDIVSGETLGLNEKFEYGVDKEENLSYTKYVGLLDMKQLEDIISDLLE